MNKKDFIEELKKINIEITEEQLKKLDRFYELLISWNEKINLTTITNKKDVYLKHFYDSLTLIKVVDLTKNITVLDVGTGAGFPGIVLKILFPNLKITLLDSLNKRINYLNEIINHLDLKDISTVCMRAEDYTKQSREMYDLVVARAVSNLSILSEITLASLKVGGYLVAMKGLMNEELQESNDIISKLNCKIVSVTEFKLPIEESTRTLVKIKKIGKTDIKYPRKYSLIKKNIKRK